MPTQVFIIPAKSPRAHKPLHISISNKDLEKKKSQSELYTPIGEQTKFLSDQKISTIKMRINPPEPLLDNFFDLDDEDQRFGYRTKFIRRQKYKEPLPRIQEDEPQHPTFSAIVSAPIVELPAELKSSTTNDYTLTSKRDDSTDLNEIQGQTLLHLAAKLDHEDIMRILINETSQGNVLLNTRGQTPLLCAIESGSTSTATLLMEQDPLSLTCKDNIGSSVFHYATEQCNDIVLSRAISLMKRLSSSTARLLVSLDYEKIFF
jgi:hypothetical protein